MTQGPDKANRWLTEHGPRLVLLARQWVGSHTDAEDVCQEAFMRFWPQRHHARDPVAYLYGCVRHAAMNWRRANHRRQAHERDCLPEPMFNASQGERLEHHELQGRVQQVLENLPAPQREVLVMRIWGELTFQAIGEVLGVPERTAQSRYRLALAALRQQLPSEPT